MNDHAARINAAIAALEAQRPVLGDAVVDTAIAPLRGQLAALQAPPAEQQLKQATVLFADIVGSTALSQRLDPEDVHTIMDGALARFTAIAQAHYGRVLNYAGDSMLAVFGADTAHEDDPERAVRAGLALLVEGRAQGETVLRHHGHEGFNVRVGIHTGPVLLGGGVDAKDSIRGMTVNIAARMEQSAPSGTLRISHDTYRLVRGVFDVEAQPPLLVKGHDEPITTYLVQRAKPRAFRVASRGIDGVETPMVGRYAELGALCDGFESVLADRSLYAVTVVGDAGLGKSRLLAEFQNTLETHPQPFWLLLGRSQPHSGLQAYGLLRDVLAWRFQIADSDSAELARQKLVDGMAPLFAEEGELSAHLLGQLIGLDFSASPLLVGMLGDARQLRDRAFQAGAQLLRRLAASDGSPLVMLLDDLHWADDGSLDFVRYLLQQQRDLPLLLVMLARPALFERRADWTDADTRHRRIDVTPLSPEASNELTDVLLHRMAEVPDVLRAMVTSGAEGNPFYMEELIKMLVDDGVIAVDGDGWHVRAERLLTARVPSTLTGVLQARLDALAPAERSALQQAAVIGHVFWDAALAALQPAATDALPALLRKELIVRRDGSAFGDAIEYAFQHHLLQQVSYDTVLKAQRRAGHIAAAAWLVQHLGERTGEYLAVAAEHYERGGDEVRALDYFEKAALDAERRYAAAAALAHVDRALASPQLTDLRRRWKLLNTKSLLLDLQGSRSLQQTILAELETLGDALDDDTLRARTRVSRALLADRVGDLATALTFAHEAWVLAERADDDDAAALALGEMAWVHCARGELDAARRHVELGLVWARRRPELHEGKLLLVAAEIANGTADYAQTERLLQQARERVRATTASRRLECAVLSGSGELAQRLGDWQQAYRYAEATMRAARDLGSPQLEGHTFLNLSTCCFEQGDAATALAHARAATRIHQRIGDRRGEAACRHAEGLALSALADWLEAQRAFGQALALYESIGDERRVRSTVSSVAQMHLDRGQVPQALAQVEKILERRHDGDSDAIDLEVMLTCHRVLAAAGDPRSRDLLETAHSELQARAARIGDPSIRERVLNNVSEHREIVAAWRLTSATSPKA